MKDKPQQPIPLLRYHVEIPFGNGPEDVTWEPATILAYPPPHPADAKTLCEGTGFRLVEPPTSTNT